MKLAALATAITLLLMMAKATAADPSALVRSYFEALRRGDFPRALALTDGAAQARTARMVARLRDEAAAKHATVELRLRQLQLALIPADGGSAPVDVQFAIDVVGHKWIFSRVARRLQGHAQFLVEDERITQIDGWLDD
jgi:hypothetical protein